jgi:DNA-binding beta-propeller fold protein YncE
VGAGVPVLPGTIVLDLDHNTILGLIENKHIVGISPDGREIYTGDRTVLSTDTHRQLRTLAFTQDILGNGFLVSPDGVRLYSRNERLDVPGNVLLQNLPLSIVTGSSWAGAPIPGGPAISSDGRRIYCCNSLQIIDTQDNTVVAPPISGSYLSDIALTPDESRILITSYSYGNGILTAYDAATFLQAGAVGGLGDFVGEISPSLNGQKAIVGSAGNPAWAASGRATVVDLSTFGIISQKLIPLADNLTGSVNDEIFIATGENGVFRRQGIDVYMMDAAGNLERVKSFFLGINRFRAATGAPQNDQIRTIIYKP